MVGVMPLGVVFGEDIAVTVSARTEEQAMLLSVGPKNMLEDEKNIGKYNIFNLSHILGLVPLGMAAMDLELRWIIGAGATIIIFQLQEGLGRLYDLCIRLRRTNLLLCKSISPSQLD